MDKKFSEEFFFTAGLMQPWTKCLEQNREIL